MSGDELASALKGKGGVFGIVWTGMQLNSVLVEPYDADSSGNLSREEVNEMAISFDGDAAEEQ